MFCNSCVNLVSDVICSQCIDSKQKRAEDLMSGKWSDCSFLVGFEPHPEVITGHKLIMAMASPIFDAMFYGAAAEKNEPIRIVDAQPDIFKALLNYIYTSKINISSTEEACQVCYLAKKYMLDHLTYECLEYLSEALNPSNVFEIYEFSQLFEARNLQNYCISLFKTHTKEILMDNSFTSTKLKTVKMIFSMDTLNIDSEMDLITAAMCYMEAMNIRSTENDKDEGSNDVDGSKEVTQNGEVNTQKSLSKSSVKCDIKNKSQMRSVIEKIHLLSLTGQEFAECPALLSLLTEIEHGAVLVNIISPDKPVLPMPRDFSTCRVKRNKPEISNAVDGDVNRASSHATIRLTIPNFTDLKLNEKNTVISSPCYIWNLPWSLEVKNTTNGTHWSVYLNCDDDNIYNDWSCRVRLQFVTVISYNPNVGNFKKAAFKFDLYNQNETGWGYQDFMTWDKVLDPDNGYLKDNAITLEVKIKAQKPEGVELKPIIPDMFMVKKEL